MRLGIRTRLRERWRTIRGLDRMAVAALTLPVGQIRLDESRFLGELVSSLTEPGPIVEIGTLFGWSTRVMALFKDRDRELITVDNYGWNPLGLPPERHQSSTAQTLAEAVRSALS